MLVIHNYRWHIIGFLKLRELTRLSLLFQGLMAASNAAPSGLEKEQVGTFRVCYFVIQK